MRNCKVSFLVCQEEFRVSICKRAEKCADCRLYLTKATFTLSAQAWYSSTILTGYQINVNTPFLQVLIPEFGYSARAWIQGLDLVLGP